MSKTSKSPLAARLSFALGGLATLILVGSLLWAGFTAPLSSRMPVPSSDGRYFAYFNRAQTGEASSAERFELIISRPQGELLERIEAAPGKIIWSGANYLVALDSSGTHATVVANPGDRFVVSARMLVVPGADPVWAPDGNKLACVLDLGSGPQLAIYDVQQRQTYDVQMPADFATYWARPIAWSPSSEHVYFLRTEDKQAVLYEVKAPEGAPRELARGGLSLEGRLPQLSPDGTLIYWGEPENVILDVETGARIWTLPPGARALWWPWPRDRGQFYYVRQEDSGSVFIHDFSSSSDQRIISGASDNGFFDLDGTSYFFRAPLPAEGAVLPVSSRRAAPVWQQAGRGGPPQSLENIELWPWERTLDGFILARRDEATSVKYGLYDPETRRLEPFKFPTVGDDLIRQVKSFRLVIATAVLFALLAGIVYFQRSDTKSGRAFPILLLLAMALGCGGVLGGSVSTTGHMIPYRITLAEIGNQGWGISSSLPQLVFRQAQMLMSWLWALLPLAILNFGFAFPDRTPFLKSRGTFPAIMLGLAALPLLATGLGRFVSGITPELTYYVVFATVVGATCVWALALAHGYKHSPSKAARHSAIWFISSLSLMGVAYLAQRGFPHGVAELLGEPVGETLKALHIASFVLAAWVAPSGMAYAVAARKPLRLGRFLSKVFRQALMGVLPLAGFTVAWALAGLVVSGSLWAFSPLAIVIAVLVAVLSVLPFRGRLRVAVDRRFDRARFESREKLADLARNLPHTVDREALALQLEEAIMKSMKARWCVLFVADRGSRKLHFQKGKSVLSSEISRMTFGLDEPLAEYLKLKDPVFEPLLAGSEEDAKQVLATAGERLGKLQAEVVLGLRRAELLGMVIVGPKTTPDLYDNEDLDSLRMVARETTAALENIDLFEMAARDREMRKELEVASDIQSKLFPTHVPKLTTGQIAGCCYPARAIAGDYYDFVKLPGRKTGLIVADVSGKGMPAALQAASLEKILASLFPATPHLGELVQKVNQELIAGSDEGKISTLFFGIYDDTSRRLEYVNAGHPPPLLMTSEGKRFLESTGLPLGLYPDISHQPRSIVLPPGAMLLIYSDGVIDARDSAGDCFGKERLAAALYRDRESDAERALARVVADIRDFEGDTLLEDDQTCILLKVYPQ